MKLSALKEILSLSNEDLISSLREGESSDTLEAQVFKILVLEDRGLRGEIEESIVQLEIRHRPFGQLSQTFYRSHNSKGFQDLKKAIELGHFSNDVEAKLQPTKELNHARSTVRNEYYAGKSLKQAGSIMLEYLFITLLFVAGWILLSSGGKFNYKYYKVAQIIYSFYSLVTVIRIAGALIKAGNMLMKR
jgi:hypothetical protein